VHAAVEGAFVEHVAPQPPQLALLVCMSTQEPLHKDHSDGQAHWPFWQVLPLVQAKHVVPAVPHIASVWLA